MNNTKIATIIRNQNDDALIDGCNRAALAMFLRAFADDTLVSLYVGDAEVETPVVKAKKTRTVKAKETSTATVDDVFCVINDTTAPISAGDVAKQLNCDGGFVSKAIKTLEKEGRLVAFGVRRGRKYRAVTAINGTAHTMTADA